MSDPNPTVSPVSLSRVASRAETPPTSTFGALPPDSESDNERAYILSTARCLLWHARIEDKGNGEPFLEWEMQIPDMEAAQRFLPLAMLPSESYKDAWYRCRPEEDRYRCDVAGSAAIRAGHSYEQEFRCFCADGSVRWLHESIQVETREPERRWEAVGVCTDITERMQVEQELRTKQVAVEELNLRLRRAMIETHHRVKNNLQLISALIDMQAMDAQDADASAELRRLANQIQSLAVVHDVLTDRARDEEIAPRVSSRAILEKLLSGLERAAGLHTLQYSVEDVDLTAKQGTALALCLQELYANARKHGKGRVNIAFRVEGASAALEVCDDGAGFPADFNAVKAANTGLELVLSLARTDLDGQVTFVNLTGNSAGKEVAGGCVTIIFPLDREL